MKMANLKEPKCKKSLYIVYTVYIYSSVLSGDNFMSLSKEQIKGHINDPVKK